MTGAYAACNPGPVSTRIPHVVLDKAVHAERNALLFGLNSGLHRTSFLPISISLRLRRSDRWSLNALTTALLLASTGLERSPACRSTSPSPSSGAPRIWASRISRCLASVHRTLGSSHTSGLSVPHFEPFCNACPEFFELIEPQ